MLTSYTQSVKQEILENLKLEPNKVIFLNILRLTSCISIKKNEVQLEISTTNQKLVYLLYKFLPIFYPEVKISDLVLTKAIKHKVYIVTLQNTQSIIDELKSRTLNFTNKKAEIKEVYEWSVALFLINGMINSPSSTYYHLEMVVADLENFDHLQNKLQTNFNFKDTIRRNKKIIYLRKAEDISDFLKFIGCIKSMFLFEEKRIERNLYTNINRLNNIDLSNQNKTIIASTKYNKIANEILDDPEKLKYLSQKDLDIIKLKLDHNNLSNLELALLYEKNFQKKISKSTINYTLRKLKKIYNK